MNINIHFWSHLAQLFLEWEVFQTEVADEWKQIICSKTRFFFENRAVYEIMRDNTVEPDRTQ